MSEMPPERHPGYIGQRMIIANVVCFPLAVLVVAVRVYTRGWIVKSMGLDDYSMILAMILSTGFSISTLVLVKLGLGKHLWEVSHSQYKNFLKVNMVVNTLFSPTIMFIKLSILFLYLRLSPEGGFRKFIYILMAIVIGYNIGSTLTNIFACIPVSKSWDDSIHGKCINNMSFYISNAALGVFTDYVILITPIRMIWKLQLSRRNRLGILAIFMTGSFACIVSTIRLYILGNIVDNSDVTWEVLNPLLWCVVEANLGIICGSASAFKPFFRKHFPDFNLSGQSKRSNGRRGRTSCSRKPHIYPLVSINSTSLSNVTNHGTPGCGDNNIHQNLGRNETLCKGLSSSAARKKENMTTMGNDSEEYIIDSIHGNEILRTTDVTVKVHDARGRSMSPSIRSG